MIWAILALLGVPLWLCALGILTLVFGNRTLRKRDGDVPARVRRRGKKRWTRGHGLWVSDVFTWRGSPAAWREDLLWTKGASAHQADEREKKKLHRLGDRPVIVSLALVEGGMVEVAAGREYLQALLGPFAEAA